MDETVFPFELKGDLGGKTFKYILENDPKNIEFVRKCWVENKTDGIFLDFFKYVKMNLSVSTILFEHEERCAKYVRELEKVPTYMKGYL